MGVLWSGDAAYRVVAEPLAFITRPGERATQHREVSVYGGGGHTLLQCVTVARQLGWGDLRAAVIPQFSHTTRRGVLDARGYTMLACPIAILEECRTELRDGLPSSRMALGVFPFPGLMSGLVAKFASVAQGRAGEGALRLAFASNPHFVHGEPSVLVRLRMPDSTRTQMILDCGIVAIAGRPLQQGHWRESYVSRFSCGSRQWSYTPLKLSDTVLDRTFGKQALSGKNWGICGDV